MKFYKFREIITKFTFILFLIFGVLNSNLFAQMKEDLNELQLEKWQNNATKAFDRASVCYNSLLTLPSDAPDVEVKGFSGKFNVKYVHWQLDLALESLNDAIRYSKMGVKYNNEDSRTVRNTFLDAMANSEFVMQIGRAYGSKSCG
jgi:hypothetical protein